jgi:2,3-bisphosphoglycerate-dependent phosphoglycerate mutase
MPGPNHPLTMTPDPLYPHPHPHPKAMPKLLRFVRHGATALNLAGLRCGGDVDAPLADVGHHQAAATARCIAALSPAVGVIVTSDLLRTKETARIIADFLNTAPADGHAARPWVQVFVQPLFAERHLGAWNGMPKAATQAWLDEGRVPPGGESTAQFKTRVTTGVLALRGLWPQRPLLVSSQGVARVLGELAGRPDGVRVANAQLAEFDLSSALLDVAVPTVTEEIL